MNVPSFKIRAGFTLIELLVVISILLVMASLIVPAIGIVQGNTLTRGGDLVGQTLNRARERAVTNNRRVEVRFYSFIPPDEPGSGASYRALQLFELDDLGNAKPIDKMQALPQGVMMSADPSFSTLFDSSRDLAFTAGSKPVLPRVGTSYTASYVQFRPNGSTDLDPTREWVVMLYSSNARVTQPTPPSNYYALEINPFSAAIRSIRP
jgi:uncharacterized protein (TIGR02596 family)